ncbi:hypothetical protein [Microvirus mar5]|uniref:Uncharacterized protein n=1 Tax=Microvirus mar5 TaxID=2851185 RepID=A0A8F5RBN7_9VIRU|nr:hypothetical protein [Microvirus mar5]
MEIHVYNRFNPQPCPLSEPQGEDMFVPDQALTIREIIERSMRGVLADQIIHKEEIPDGMDEYYSDFTEMIQPDESDEPS